MSCISSRFAPRVPYLLQALLSPPRRRAQVLRALLGRLLSQPHLTQRPQAGHALQLLGLLGNPQSLCCLGALLAGAGEHLLFALLLSEPRLAQGVQAGHELGLARCRLFRLLRHPGIDLLLLVLLLAQPDLAAGHQLRHVVTRRLLLSGPVLVLLPQGHLAQPLWRGLLLEGIKRPRSLLECPVQLLEGVRHLLPPSCDRVLPRPLKRLWVRQPAPHRQVVEEVPALALLGEQRLALLVAREEQHVEEVVARAGEDALLRPQPGPAAQEDEDALVEGAGVAGPPDAGLSSTSQGKSRLTTRSRRSPQAARSLRASCSSSSAFGRRPLPLPASSSMSLPSPAGLSTKRTERRPPKANSLLSRASPRAARSAW